jgi:lipid-binding SYLF domain-containing protein
MIRVRVALAIAACLAAAPQIARAQGEQQALVDRSTLTAQDMLNDVDGRDAQHLLRRARATMICPRVFRAGFLFGGSGGGCVLVARDGAGSWSSPAFYSMGSGSFGFQAGIQDSEVMMMILTDRGLRAVMDSQFKLGADAGATFVEWGGGIEGATTGAIGADIVGFTRSRGLFAGISISGSVLSSRSGWNRTYYGKEAAAQQIVISMDANNPGATPLREVLSRFGSSVTATPGAMPIASNDPLGAPPPPLSQPMPAQPLAPIRSQNLPPVSSNRY